MDNDADLTAREWLSRSPSEEEREAELVRLRERLAFYQSFDGLIQDNITRSGDLLRQAMQMRESAAAEIASAKAEHGSLALPLSCGQVVLQLKPLIAGNDRMQRIQAERTPAREEGEDLIVTLALPEQARIRFWARVVWVAKNPKLKGKPGMGLTFTRIDAKERATIAAFVRDQKSQPEPGGEQTA